VRKIWLALAIAVGLACVVMAVMVVKRPPMKPGAGGVGVLGGGGGRAFDEQMKEMEKIDPKLLICKEAARHPTGIAKLTGLAVGPDDRIYAVGDKTLIILGSDGTAAGRVELGQAPTCVAVGPDSTVYVGLMDHVELLDAKGARKASWPSLGATGWITSIAANENEVYVADFGQKRLVKYDKGGKVLARLGPEGPDQGRFQLPSPNFDVAVDASGSPWVVQTEKHLITNFREDGSVATSWGKSGPQIDSFSGCCNPTHIAIRRDGSFITSEKGLVRVKIHGPAGELIGVVAQSSDFRKDIHGLDLAVDSKDRFLVLDPETGTVRVYVLKAESRP
jgi:DNA-binding beta-propeller fold protein YncE